MFTVTTLLTACATAADNNAVPTSTSASPARVPAYVCDEAIVTPLGIDNGKTTVVTGRGNCQPAENTAVQDGAMRGPWQIIRRLPTPATYDCGKEIPAFVGPDGKLITTVTISGRIETAPDYVNGFDCIP